MAEDRNCRMKNTPNAVTRVGTITPPIFLRFVRRLP
jgi:hypothetical protein